MLIAKRKKQLRKYVRRGALMAVAFCVAMGLFSASIFAESYAASPAGLHATARAASFTAPNDADFSKQWVFKPFTFGDDAFPYTNIDKAWALMPASAQKLRVAVLDEGFDVDHPDLAANMNKNLAWNTHEGNRDVSPEPGTKGHGTHVAGIFGAVAENGEGIAGVAKNLAEIIPIKIAYTHGNGQFGVDLTETAKGIDYAVANGCKIINMSNGTYYATGSRHAVLDAAIANAINHGVILVAAAGNGNKSDTIFPSDHDDVISVTAVTHTGEKASYSDFNAQKNIAAPGGGQKEGSSISKEIYSTIPNNSYGEKHGTSMAAPFVSGVLTLMLAANPNLTADEATDILYDTATDLGDAGRDDIFGHGLVNAEAAVEKALEMKAGAGSGGGDNGGNSGAGGGDNSGNSGAGGDNSGNGGTGTGGGGDNSGTGGGDNSGTSGGNGSNPDTGAGGGDNSGNGGTGGGGDNSGTGGGDNGGNSSAGAGGGNNGSNPDTGAGGGNSSANSGSNTDGNNANNGNNTGVDTGGNGNSTDVDANTAPAKNSARYKITFRVNGGKKLKAALMKKTVLFGEKYGKLPKPKRNNHKFLGWYTKKTGGIKITKKSTVQIQKNHRLYAHWKRK